MTDKEEFIKKLENANVQQYMALPIDPKITLLLTYFQVIFIPDRPTALVKADYWIVNSAKWFEFISGDEEVVATFRKSDVFSITKQGHVK